MAAERVIVTDALLWQGVVIEIAYEENWLGIERSKNQRIAHLSITAIEPKRARLPITETGYRSHFVHPDDVAEAGGAVAFVRAWLDWLATSRAWRAHVESSRQLRLF